MSFFPEILPADPAAPEGKRYQTKALEYGVIGRLFMFFENVRERQDITRVSETTLRGMTRDDARTLSERPLWDVPAGWRTDIERCLSRPGLL